MISQCLELFQYDIITVTESHLVDDNILHVNGYQWCDHNINDVHIRARRKGSGGVGALVKWEL